MFYITLDNNSSIQNPSYAVLMTIQNTYDHGELLPKDAHIWEAVDFECSNYGIFLDKNLL